MRRIRSVCCALVASGHAAAPPMSVMNSRRLMLPPRLRTDILPAQTGGLEVTADVRFGSKADIAERETNAALPQKRTLLSVIGMSLCA